MKVKELVEKCGLANTEFVFNICSKTISKATADSLLKYKDVENGIMQRTVNTYRVINNEMIIYIKPTAEEFELYRNTKIQ